MEFQSFLDSIYSDSSANFVSNPYPVKGQRVTFSIRFLKNDFVSKVFLRAKEFGVEYLYQMEKSDKKSGNLLEYYEASLSVKDKRFCYQFYFVTDRGIFYYTQNRITDYIPDEAQDFVLLVDYKAPSWVGNSVFYQIFPDRFCNGREDLNVKSGEYKYQGFSPSEEKWDLPSQPYEKGHNLDFRNGDLYGIIQKLDYLQELGINALYLNPIFLSPSVHKYDALDYFKIDPHLGGQEALAELSAEVHKRGMKLMLDISINHTSNESVWFKKASCLEEKSQAAAGTFPKERDWYFFKADGSYECWFGVKTMPQLNYGSESLRDEIYRKKDSVLKKWLAAPYNIDGWRFDVADCLARNDTLDVHAEVIREIRRELKGEKEDLYLLAEEWQDCSVDLQGDAWDSTMNYFGCGRPLREFAGAKDLYLERNEILKDSAAPLTARQLAARISQFYSRLPGALQNQLFNLMDSHDVVRLHTVKGVNEDDVKLAAVLQFTLPGTPSLYYGDEIFLSGDNTFVDGCRDPFDWNWEKSEKAKAARAFYKKLIWVRRSEKALCQGSFKILFADDDTILYSRFTCDEVIFTAASKSDEEKEILLPLEQFDIKSDCNSEVLLGEGISLTEKDKKSYIKIKPHKAGIIKFFSSSKK